MPKPSSSSTTSPSFGFGGSSATALSFGTSSATAPAAASSQHFGASSSGSGFGLGLSGASSSATTASSAASSSPFRNSSLLGSSTSSSGSGQTNLFGASSFSTGGLFGSSKAPETQGLFGSAAPATGAGPFGAASSAGATSFTGFGSSGSPFGASSSPLMPSSSFPETMDEEEENEDAKNSEMAQLEKEYMDLQHEEQDILKNIKQQKDDDFLKGQSVKSQMALWDKTLEIRFMLQKAFSSSNRLPQETTRSLFCEAGDGVSEAYSVLVTSSKRTLNSLLQLQEALLETNSSITQSAEGVLKKKSQHTEDSGCSFEEGDEDWTWISQMHSRMSSFRDESIDRWQRKTQVTSGAAAIRGKLRAFNKSISEQVATYMRDPSKMIKGMQQSRSAVGVFGSVLDSNGYIRTEGTNADDDAELLDDPDFYQYLLKEFVEGIDPSSSEMAFYAHKRSKPKKRKLVDRRASKSRKIRYNVHEKIVNFMAPQPMDLPPIAPKLFENLFGRKPQTPATAA